ncbi:MAG: serine/threonine protein kinase [Anaerolineales bacterium]|nr:serine/threonine protein kinase [Anaerolineales bacterium]
MTFALEQEIGPYRIVSQLGRGGMATVFKAYHAALDRYVAIKVPVADFQANPDVLARFKREVKIIAKLDHPNIIPIYDVSEFEGTPYLVMRFVEGRTLREFLSQYKKAVSLNTIMTIMRAVTGALTFAHQKQVLHRDVKPSNIMLGNDGSVYLMDFGLARIVAEADLTLSKDIVIGTPYYISPEQAKGEPLDERTDVYSLGIVLYELLAGRVPFTGERPSIVVYHHISTPPPPPSTFNLNISPSLEQVVLKALVKDKTLRFASAAEMMAALQEVVQSEAQMLPQVLPVPLPPKSAEDAPKPPAEMKTDAAPARQLKSPSTLLLALSILILISELIFFFPALRLELRRALASLGSSGESGGGSDLMRIIIGTLSAYIATLSTHIILNAMRKRMSGAAFFFAVAFGVTMFIALLLGFVVLLLLNVL